MLVMAYQTANDTEGNFETADERQTTESDDFQTGAESMAGDSTDDLTETEDTASHQAGTRRALKPSLAFKPAGDRQSFMSTASDEDELKTPVVAQAHKFRLRNGRQSFARPRVPTDNTPTHFYSEATSQDSPATVTDERSPPAGEQSLFVEMGEFDDTSSFGTPGRVASLASVASTPGVLAYTPSKRATQEEIAMTTPKAAMVDAGTMTELIDQHDGEGDRAKEPAALAAYDTRVQSPLPSGFPLPTTSPNSPIKHIDHSTQYTPQRSLHESPLRNTAFITPPKTVWDEAQSPEAVQAEEFPTAQTPKRFEYSGLVMHNTSPASPEVSRLDTPAQPDQFSFSSILSQTTEPVPTPHRSAFAGIAASNQSDGRPSPSRKGEIAMGAGVLASAAAALGFAKSKDASAPYIAEDETSQTERTLDQSVAEKDLPLKDISGNSVSSKAIQATGVEKSEQQRQNSTSVGHDQGSQTLLTAEQIEEALRPKTTVAIPLAEPMEPTSPLSPTHTGDRFSDTRSRSYARNQANRWHGAGKRYNEASTVQTPF